jgi:putative membrane protein
MRSTLLHVVRGFVMGSADLVPGVSGGTVALVLGYYRRLVDAIRTGAGALGSLLRFDLAECGRRLRSVEWSFLAPLLVGVAVAILSLSSLLERLLETQPVRMAGLFFGLVAASVVVMWRSMESLDWKRSGVLLGVGIVTFVFLGLRAGPVEDPTWWMFLGAGAIAVCAMILPGISGSFILLMMGMYEAVIGAVSDRDIGVMVLVAVGVVTGLASFSTVLHKLLDTYGETVMAALVGLMLGSLRVLWPWPSGTGGTDLSMPSGDVAVPVALALVGAGVVLMVTNREARLAVPDTSDVGP